MVAEPSDGVDEAADEGFAGLSLPLLPLSPPLPLPRRG
jgi:hypothetical protein